MPIWYVFTTLQYSKTIYNNIFQSILGDVIIIWRVSAFYYERRERWVLVFPVALLVGSMGTRPGPIEYVHVTDPVPVTAGLVSFCVAKTGQNPGVGEFVNPPFCTHVQLSFYTTTLATTGVATALISYKTW